MTDLSDLDRRNFHNLERIKRADRQFEIIKRVVCFGLLVFTLDLIWALYKETHR